MLETFIRKPVLGVTLCLLIVLLGITAYYKLPVRQFPLLPSSEVTITTDYPGANPAIMESYVSMPMQQALTGLTGIDYLSSTNTEGQSVITLKFFLGTDIDAILPQIANRISGIIWELPRGINSPQILKIDPNAAATGAILYIDGNSTKLSSEQMTEYLERTVIPRFEAIPGVAQVQMFGAREYAMRIWLDPLKMAAHHVTATDVVDALKANNINSTAGTLNSYELKFNVNTNSNLTSTDQFNNLVVAANNNHYVRIKDIGKAELGATEYTNDAYANGKPTVMTGVMTTDTANSIATADRVKKALKELQHVLPPGMHVDLVWDVTQFARQSIKEVHLTIVEAALFVFLVIFLFLGSLRSIIIPMVTIPISMLGAAAIMWGLDYSLNTLTLLSWVLAIGLVVDDSIVVLENIHRHMEMGKTRLQAAIDGVTELKHPIVVITLAVAIVFAPIGFVPGISGALFKEFAFTISLVVLVSGLLALFVSPMMCTKLLAAHGEESKLTLVLDRIFKRIRHHYQQLLLSILAMRWLIIILFILLLLGGVKLLQDRPSELIPTENEGVLISMGIGPSDANLEYLRKYSAAFNTIYDQVPEKVAYGLFNANPLIGPNTALSWILIDTHKKGARSEDQIMAWLNQQLQKIPGLLAFAIKQPTVPGAMPGQPVKFVLKTTGSYEQLSEQLAKLIAAANNYPGLTDPNTTFKMDKVQVDVNINREKADVLGVPISEIANTLSIMMGEPIINRFSLGGYSYEVIPQVFRHYRLNPVDIKQMYVKNISGKLIPLSNVVTINESVAPQSLDQFQQLRSATLQAGIAPGYTMGQVLNFLENYVKTNMPGNFAYDFIGQTREFVQSSGALVSAFIFALVLIYLLLAAHFNSFKDPFVVMLSVPLAIAGAIFFMFLTDSTLNIYTKIGLIMLVGLISKHGILIVDFANNLQEQGKGVRDAVVEAATIRLRPILMTTAAMISGALPLVLSSGAGSIARAQIGWVIIGGMSLGTLLTLFVVPTAYTMLASRIKHHDK